MTPPSSHRLRLLLDVAFVTGVIALSACGKPPAPAPPQSTASDDRPRPHSTNSAAPLAWNQFRGGDQGRASVHSTLPTTWSETNNIAWKTAIPGAGASSPVLGETTIWLTAAAEDDRSLRAIALDQVTGAIVHNKEVFALPVAPAKHRVNGPASPTPALHNDRLFVSFGTFGIACLNTSDATVIWKNTELQFDDEKMGPGSSPILIGDILVVSCDGTDHRFIAGLHKDTGKVIWKTDRSNRIAQAIPYRKSFSTPLFAELNGIPQIISSSSYRLFGYEPGSGKELWSVEIPGFCPIPVPAVENNQIYVCTGYNKAELWAFEAQPDKKPKRLWKSSRSIPLISSPVLVPGRLYLVSQDGIASSIDAGSGDMLWNERLGGAYWASPLYSGGNIYFFAENGLTTVVAAGSEFNVVAKNPLAGEIMASPACSTDSFFIRTKTHLYRVTSSLEAAPLAGRSK